MLSGMRCGGDNARLVAAPSVVGLAPTLRHPVVFGSMPPIDIYDSVLLTSHACHASATHVMSAACSMCRLLRRRVPSDHAGAS